ncbi:LCP family protein [Actinophytocola sp.]|uniref:LCP family protein n=1 Tax=Actinophytocola sp. TaxID=1872138 RepID=UPI00389A5D2E
MTDRTEQLVREAFAEEAERAADPREVLANVRGRRPRRSYGLAFATAAVVAVVAAVATFVVPSVFRESTPPAGEARHQTAAVTPMNVLVVGVDTNGYTDSIVLVQLGKDGSTSLVSLPRDAWVSAGGAMTKLNQVYVRSGADALATEVGELTGVHVDHWAAVDMAVLPDLLSAVGGVEICLNSATSDRFAGADFPAGKQVVSGQQALAFLRQRHGLPNSDLDRIIRLQVFVKSLLTKLKGSDPHALVTAARDHVRTDPGLDVLGLAQDLVRGGALRFGTIPHENADVQTPQGAAIGVDPVQVKQFVANLPNTPPADPGDVPCVN